MASNAESAPSLRLAAVGDVLLAPPPAGVSDARNPALVAPEVRDLLAGCDVVFANLECTLPGDGRRISTEPRVVATPALVRAVRQAGVTVVSLANNHAFDALEAGFDQVRALLDELGVAHFGAGKNLEEAEAPAVVEARGVRLGFLGAVDRRSGPSQFAAEGRWGVAPHDADRLAGRVRRLREVVDHVIVSIHWGEERFLIPSPVQIGEARALVEAGTSAVLGHHPHVLQGLETRDGRPIIYSLGNFVADDVWFSDGDVMRWNPTERTGCVFQAELTCEATGGVTLLPTYDDGREVRLDRSGRGRRRIERTRRALRGGVSLGRYRREHLWVKTLRPALARLRWSRLKSLRPRHFRNALRRLLEAPRAG